MAENYSFSVILEPQEGAVLRCLSLALPEVVTEAILRRKRSPTRRRQSAPSLRIGAR